MLGDVSKVFAMNWRFLPMLDPQVSHMVSRDLDSLINEREAAAVQEWLASDKGKWPFLCNVRVFWVFFRPPTYPCKE